MSALAPILESFFTDRLNRQLHASRHTVRAYRDTFRLLLQFATQRTGKQPSQLELTDIDAALITEFLDHLEHERDNTVRTRNARLGRDPFDVPLRLLPRTRPRCAHPTRAGHARQAGPAPDPVVPVTRRSRRAPRRTRPQHVDRPTRSRPARRRRPDRATRVGALRVALPRHRARHRRPRSLLGQRPQGTLHPAHPPHRQRDPGLARRARPRRGPARVPDPTWRPAPPRLDRRSRRPPRRHRPPALPGLDDQEGDTAHPAPHRRDDTARGRRRHQPSSPCGSATNTPKRPRSTSTATSR